MTPLHHGDKGWNYDNGRSRDGRKIDKHLVVFSSLALVALITLSTNFFHGSVCFSSNYFAGSVMTAKCTLINPFKRFVFPPLFAFNTSGQEVLIARQTMDIGSRFYCSSVSPGRSLVADSRLNGLQASKTRKRVGNPKAQANFPSSKSSAREAPGLDN